MTDHVHHRYVCIHWALRPRLPENTDWSWSPSVQVHAFIELQREVRHVNTHVNAKKYTIFRIINYAMRKTVQLYWVGKRSLRKIIFCWHTCHRLLPLSWADDAFGHYVKLTGIHHRYVRVNVFENHTSWSCDFEDASCLWLRGQNADSHIKPHNVRTHTYTHTRTHTNARTHTHIHTHTFHMYMLCKLVSLLWLFQYFFLFFLSFFFFSFSFSINIFLVLVFIFKKFHSLACLVLVMFLF